MKSFIIVVALIVCFFTSKAQNLIDNWSFEDTVSCPIWAGQINQSTGWMSFRNSPDYFHVCHTNPLQFGVPNNSFDYQYPRTGNAYAGFIAFLLSGFNTREALGTQLNSTLQIGQKYFATFYVSRVAKNLSSINVAIDKIGLKFSTVAYSHPNFPPPNNFSHIYSDSIITDTLNWNKISGSFIADSNYSFVCISVFFDDNNVSAIQMVPGSITAYYFVDDICVSTDSLYCHNLTNISEVKNTEFEIYPNPAHDYININSKDIKSLKFFDITGRLQKELFYQSENIDISDLSTGIYLVEIIDQKNTFYKKIIKN